MTAKNSILLMLLLLCIGQAYQIRQHYFVVSALALINSKLPMVEYCTWDRGNYTLAVDKANKRMVAETVAKLGESVEGCK